MVVLKRAGTLLLGGGHLGEVASFDDTTGLGSIALGRVDGLDGADGADRAHDLVMFSFHCTQIADGSRTVAIGTKVRFKVIPANLGRFEAGSIEPR